MVERHHSRQIPSPQPTRARRFNVVLALAAGALLRRVNHTTNSTRSTAAAEAARSECLSKVDVVVVMDASGAVSGSGRRSFSGLESQLPVKTCWVGTSISRSERSERREMRDRKRTVFGENPQKT